MTASDALRPCPFCGGRATHAKTVKGWKVECEGRMGSCTMNARTHYQPTKWNAYDAWNRRVLDDRAAAISEAWGRAYWLMRGYAVHSNDCKINKPPRFDGPCSCGLTAALEEALALLKEQPDYRADQHKSGAA